MDVNWSNARGSVGAGMSEEMNGWMDREELVNR